MKTIYVILLSMLLFSISYIAIGYNHYLGSIDNPYKNCTKEVRIETINQYYTDGINNYSNFTKQLREAESIIYVCPDGIKFGE
jgi:hypothetical protein